LPATWHNPATERPVAAAILAALLDPPATLAPPLAVNDVYPQPLTGPTTVPGSGVLSNDTNPCGASAVVRLVSAPTNGSVALNSNGGFTYTPKGSTVDDSFVYEILCPGVPVSI
jgi:hypothetical protein